MAGGSADERAAIVTGVSRGLGAALARELLARGFLVLGVGRTNNPALGADRYRFAQCDLADTAAIDTALMPAFEDLMSRPLASVCLFNNAATVESTGVMGRLTAAEITTALATNLTAAVALANLFCRVFGDTELPRRVLNISSAAAGTTIPGEAVYCVAKAGIEMLTRALAAEQAASVSAITVRPGVMDTEMQSFARSRSQEVLPAVDLFKGFEREGRLVPPELVASKIVARLVIADIDNGRTYSYQDL